jgi:galactose oxidase
MLLDCSQVLAWSAKQTADYRGKTAQTQTVTFNPTSGAVSAMTVSNTNHDMFCPGMSTLGSGAIVVTGGNTAEKTSIYMPGQGWASGPDMNIPRGYQGQTTLSNGEVRLHPTLHRLTPLTYALDP